MSCVCHRCGGAPTLGPRATGACLPTCPRSTHRWPRVSSGERSWTRRRVAPTTVEKRASLSLHICVSGETRLYRRLSCRTVSPLEVPPPQRDAGCAHACSTTRNHGRKCVGTSSPRPPDRILLTDRAILIRAQHQDARCHPDTRAHVRREHAFDARGAPCYYATRAHATWRRLAAAVWPASTIQPGHQQGCRAVHPLECCPAGCEQFLASLRCRRQLCNCRWCVRLCQWRGASGGMLTGCAVQLQAKCAATTTFATRDSGDTIRRPPRLVAGLRSPPPARLPRFATSSPSQLVFDLATGWQAQLYHVRVRGFGRGNCSIVCA